MRSTVETGTVWDVHRSLAIHGPWAARLRPGGRRVRVWRCLEAAEGVLVSSCNAPGQHLVVPTGWSASRP
jgi:hypothetical protein